MSYVNLLAYQPVFFFTVAIISLCVGSLLNVIISRLPKMLNQQWQQHCSEIMACELPPQDKINLFFPRSHCPKCSQLIKAWQNIPIVSYLFLRGRCFYCKQSISWRYPFIEALTVALSLLIAWQFGPGLVCIAALLFTWMLICLCFIDIDHQLLPDNLTLSLLWLGLLCNTQGMFISLENAVISAAIAYLLLWSFMQLFYLITGKIGMGHGDFKLLAALCAWVGWQQLPFILIFSSLSGAIIGIIVLKLKSKDKDTPIPFGPFLCVAGYIALLYGQSINEWYLTTML